MKGLIFSPGAVDYIFRYSAGIPRNINNLCDNALLNAFASNATIIGRSIIEEVAAQVMAGKERLLIESLCHRIGETLFERIPAIHSLEVALRKLDPPLDSPAEYAEIRMTWQR